MGSNATASVLDRGDDDAYGHLFPSEAQTLATAIDDLCAENRTNKRRTTPSKGRIRGKRENSMSQLTLDSSEVGPVGLEPTTNGLKARCSTN